MVRSCACACAGWNKEEVTLARADFWMASSVGGLARTSPVRNTKYCTHAMNQIKNRMKLRKKR